MPSLKDQAADFIHRAMAGRSVHSTEGRFIALLRPKPEGSNGHPTGRSWRQGNYRA
jgi:hypothetical protein